MIEIIEADKKSDFKVIEILATEILYEVYDPIIPTEHTDFFLKKFQSVKAIEYQIKNENFKYYLLRHQNKNIGYLGMQKLNKTLILSKLYILKSFRGLKIGKKALDFVDRFTAENEIEKIELIVNRQNENTIAFYQKYGFKIIEPIINSFPNGYDIEDYKMEKIIVDQTKTEL